VSRRKQSTGQSGHPARAAAGERSGRPAAHGRPDAAERSAEEPSGAPAGRLNLAAEVAILAAVFVVTALVAELAGAANLGVAIGVGQIAFVLALVALLLRGP
jgi:hypothetical protein